MAPKNRVMTTGEQLPTKADFPSWAHPTNLYYESEWQRLRDTMLGEKQVKSRTTEYVPQSSGFDDEEYEAYLDRASFYNMVARTVSGMLGTLFRRTPMATGIPAGLDLKSLGFEGESLYGLMRSAAQEVIHVGRLGALVDRSVDGKGNPYIVLYPVESIIQWNHEVINGRKVPTDIILRESKEYTAEGQPNKVRTEYRRLRLIDGEYSQWLYRSTENEDATITQEPEIVIPLNRGRPLDRIPFEFVNATSTKADVERPHLIDVARINLSHFRASTQLEHGRFFTGNPVYYCRSNGSDQSIFDIGASTLWKLPVDGTAGIIEFNGAGLRFLESSLTEKESHAAALGGRLIGVSSQSTAESDNMTAMKERNENSLLLNISFTLETAFTRLLQHVARWMDFSEAQIEKIEVECSKDFMLSPVGAREFRAMHMLYTDGIITVDIVFDYLRRAEVIPDWLELEEFKRMLASKNSFPGQPDAEARMNGFPSKQSQLNDDLAWEELGQEERMAKDAQRFQRETAEANRRAAEAAARNAQDNPSDPSEVRSPVNQPRAR